MTELAYRLMSLDQLRFGHEATPPLNPRKVGRNANLETLAASLLAHGQGQAMNVRQIDGITYVIDGNRRLAAFRLLVEQGKLPADHPVKIDLDTTADGGELSLALNLEREAMHPADIYRAFREINAKGIGEKDIATRFGMKPKEVRQYLAIGDLHEVVLDGWRDGIIREDTVKAFTIAGSLEQQAEVYKRLKDKGGLYAYNVREALGASDREAAQLLTFVGEDEYKAAGGRIIKDLFGDEHVIGDRGILDRLASEKLQAELDRLTAEGWSWVSLAKDLPDAWSWNWAKQQPDLLPTEEEAAELARLRALFEDADPWRRTKEEREAEAAHRNLQNAIRPRCYTAEHKAAGGAVVYIDHHAQLAVSLGVIKPSASKKDKDAPASGLSNALMARLSVQLTQAARDAITTDPHVGLAALLAGLSASLHGQPVKVSASGMAGARVAPTDFAASLSAFLAMPDSELVAAAAQAAIATLDMTVINASNPPLGVTNNATLADALPAEAMNQALRDRFDAADYFAGAAIPIVLRAIGEALNADEARKAEKLKKADLVTFALANVPPTGWLPPELRTAHYAGPATKPEAPKKTRVKRTAMAEQVAA
jgi:ParB family chromosome partitioning protein